MAVVFGVDVRTVNEHIVNIFKSGELEEDSTIRKFRIVQKEGKREVKRDVGHYNLDMLISVGYRVNSMTATKFRQWATKTLKEHIAQGYTVNQHLLDIKKTNAQRIIDNIQQLALSSKKVQTSDVLELVKAFTHTWFSLQSYDEGALPTKGKHVLNTDIQVSEL